MTQNKSFSVYSNFKSEAHLNIEEKTHTHTHPILHILLTNMVGGTQNQLLSQPQPSSYI